MEETKSKGDFLYEEDKDIIGINVSFYTNFELFVCGLNNFSKV